MIKHAASATISISILKCLQRPREFLASLLGFFLFLAGGQMSLAYTISGNTFTTDGSFADVQAACYAATSGNIVQVPAGVYTWGSTNQRLYITSAITLQGAGTNLTTINLPYNSTDYYGNGVITPSAAATIEGMYITGTNSPATAITPSGNGWRITDVLFDVAGGAHFIQASGYGLIDHCTFKGYGGSDEMIFCYGPTTSWQTPDSMGTTNAVVVENCLFAGSGYVCDMNANARAVIRFCTITGEIKIDGHGKASNSPPRGVRQMEIYGNQWTDGSGPWTTIELRGGTGMIFNNYAVRNTNGYTWWKLDEYGCTAQWPNFKDIYQTPINYPIDDQIGVGEDPKVAASDPVYTWNNTNNGSLMAGSNSWTWVAVAAGAIATYTNETGNPNATFTMQSIIASDRDYFINPVNPFNGSSGIGIGSKSQMVSITATRTNVGFWVTNEASWNTTLPANTSGQLYTWNGSGWSLKYTPLVYPYPGTASTALDQNLNPPSNLHIIISTNSVAIY